MESLVWHEHYKTGVDDIDSQYKRIIELINLIANADSGDSRDLLSSVIREIITTLTVHFDLEETLMEQLNYPCFNVHKKLHDRYLKRVLELSLKCDAGECVAEEVYSFFRGWITSHISEDRDFVQSLVIGDVAS